METITILASRAGEAEAKLEKLIRKAKRLGVTPIRYTMSKPYEHKSWNGVSNVTSNQVDVTIDGEAPYVNGFEFVARLQFVGDQALVLAAPGQNVPERFRKPTNECDHCSTQRARKDVFLLRDSETGELIQIGRNCLADYIEGDAADAVRTFDHVREVRDELVSYGSSGTNLHNTAHILAATSAVIRTHGFMSQGRRRALLNEVTTEEDEKAVPIATSALVSDYLFEGHKPKYGKSPHQIVREQVGELTEEDWNTAHATIAYFQQLDPKSNYEHNLKVLLGETEVNVTKLFGMVVSAVAAYQRHLDKLELAKVEEKKREQIAKVSEYVGTVGERLRGLGVTVEKVIPMGDRGYGPSYLVKMVDGEQNRLAWFTGSTELREGDEVAIDGTVKGQKEFRGVKETQLTRCKVQELEKGEV